MRFNSEWWMEFPLYIDPIAIDLSELFLDKELCGILEGWPIVDESCVEAAFDCWGYICPIDDVVYTIDMRKVKKNLGIELLGFNSEFNFDPQIALPILLTRYITYLLEGLLDKSTDMINHQVKVERKKRIAVLKELPQYPLKLRFAVLTRDGFKCKYCGRSASEVKLQVDHILARHKGGKDKLSNYITACVDCNIGKSDILLLAAKNRLMIKDEGQIPSFMAFG